MLSNDLLLALLHVRQGSKKGVVLCTLQKERCTLVEMH